ncbi:MAG TPA: hypothetical protein VIV82_11585, partial [Verrucomicrobiae bacterium]
GAKAETKHIILFADAADSEEPGDYIRLLEKCAEAGVTVSVIGLGTENDSDANLLKDIAARGGGTCYFTDSPEEIPRLFAQDTFTVARSTFVDQPTAFDFTAGFSSIGSGFNEVPPNLGGYNLCYIRPEANLAAVTSDEYQAPVVASWNAGNGRVLCFLGEADGKFSGDFARWNQAGEFYSTLARWAAGKRQALPDDQLLVQEVRDGICLVQLHLDPNRKADPFSGLPQVKVLHGRAGTPPAKATLAMQWKSADLLEATVPISGRETVLNTVEIPGESAVTLAPVCLPYSPEFAPDQPGRGSAALEQIATTSGGQERVELSQIWADLQVKPRFVELSPWLLVLAALFFLGEIFERRTGWIGKLFRRAPDAALQTETEQPNAKPASRGRLVKRFSRPAKKPAPVPTRTAAPGAPKPQSTPVVAPEAGAADSNLEALRKARERANRRTSRD